jgi:hypothetical protein
MEHLMGYIINPGEAFRLLQESEKYGGHPCTKHIGLSNNKLMERLQSGEGARNGGIQYISTFTYVRDAAKAASQTFKNLPGSIHIALQKGGNKASFPPIRTDEAFKVRFALGGGVREYYVNHMKLVVFRHPDQRETTFFVKTFYPLPPNELLEKPMPGNA